MGAAAKAWATEPARCRAPATAVFAVALLEDGEEVGVGGLRRDVPLGLDSGSGVFSGVVVGRDDADEVAVVDDLDAGELFSGAGVERRKRGVESGGTERWLRRACRGA